MDPLLNTASVAALENLINRLIQQDPSTLIKIRELEGKTLAINCQQPNIRLTITLQREGVYLSTQDTEVATDAEITMTVSDAFALLAAQDKNAEVLRRQLKIVGDTQLFNTVFQMFSQFEIDWEAHLSQVIGGLAAHQIHQGWQKIWALGQAGLSNFRNNFAEFVEEEAPFTSSQTAFEAFKDDLFDLKIELDRLEARMDRLIQHSRHNNSSKSVQDKATSAVDDQKPPEPTTHHPSSDKE